MENVQDIQTVNPMVVQPPADEGTLMNLIAKMATDQTYDITRLERLILLRNDEIAARAKREYNEDFVQMKPNLPKVIKQHDNQQTRSKYAKLEDINTQIDPVLSRYGFGTTSKVIRQDDKTVTMLLEIKHKGGHSDTMELTMPIDDEGAKGNANKTKLHGISSTITYIKRVGFSAMLNISTGDDKDGNSNSPQGNIDIAQAAEIDTRLRALSDVALPNFLKWASVESLTEIPARNYQRCIKALIDMEAQAKKAGKI